jgi:hypothetical protein
MARRTVRCSCGADFPIPEIQPSLLHCPRCGEPVRFKAPEGGAIQVREDIREQIRPLPPRNPYYPLIILCAVGVLITGGLVSLVILFSGREVKREPTIVFDATRPKPRTRPEDTLISIPEIPSHAEPAKTAETPPSPPRRVDPPPPAPDSAEMLGRLQQLSARMNLTGIVSTVLLLSHRTREYRDLQATLGTDDAELRKLAARLVDRPELPAMKDHFQAGDALMGFAGLSLDPAHPQAFSDAIRDWLAAAQPGATVLASVQRSGATLLLPMWFPEIPADIVPKDLRAGTKAAESVVTFPPEVLSDVQRRMAALHPFYRKTLPPEDVGRAEKLVKEGRGSAADLDFLRNRLLAYCARSESELAGFESRVSSLESAVATAQNSDAVVFKDGRRITGQIVEDTEEYVRLKGRFGAMKAPKSDVLRIERGDAFLTEFRRRYDGARGKTADLTVLLGWCKERNLVQPRELAAYAILRLDPGDDAAWTALGVADRASPPGGPEFDVLLLKDGTRREGIISGETEAGIQIDVVVRGTKAETIGTGKATIARADIERIERMNDAARQRAKERAASFGNRAQKLQDAMSRVTLTPETIQGLPAFRTSGTHFELHSTCPATQVRETACTLEEMFNAYRRHFSVRRNAARRVDVFFFATSTEYEDFQHATRGGVSLNPAYFDIQANHIAAYYGVQKEDESRIRAIILGSEREIELYKKEISAAEERIAKEFRSLRQDVLDQASRDKKVAGEDGKQLAAIERVKQENLNVIKGQERTAIDQLAKLRTRANQSIADHERVIRHNQAVLVSQTRVMYETLFHESFHAFAANFLWEEADNAGLPRWLHEGMATYFERSVVEAGELIHGGAHPSFLNLLRGLQGENRMLPIGAVVSASADMFQIQHVGDIPRQDAAYAHAWGLAHYLISRGMTREQLEEYVTDLSAGKNRVAAFEKLAGRKVAEIEAEWRVHLNSLK